MKTTKNNKYVGECLKEFLKEQKLVQEDVASKLGVSYQRVNALLNGTPFGKKVAAQWEILFGINAYWLLTGKGAMLTNGTTPEYARKIIAQCNNGVVDNTSLPPANMVTTGDIVGNHNNVTEENINLPVATAEDDVIDAEIVEIPIVPTAVVRQPDTQLSKWVDKCAGDAERLRFGEILANATIAREVKELDMAPDLKVGQYICLELLPHDTPIKNGKIYFIDHSQLGGFFRKLYDRGDNILCRARNRSYEDFTIDKAHIYDLYRIVGVFSTDVIEDPRDEQIDHFMEQTNHLLEQHDAHNANIEKLIDNTHRLVEQQGVLISVIVNKKEK